MSEWPIASNEPVLTRASKPIRAVRGKMSRLRNSLIAGEAPNRYVLSVDTLVIV